MKRARGFTLIELLVVVAIIAILIAILIPSLSKAKEMAHRAVCATNLKSQGTAMATYAAGANDALPMYLGLGYDGATNAAGYWLHDEPPDFANQMIGLTVASGAQNLSATSIRRWFYCPSNPNSNADSLWNYIVGAPANTIQTYRALGYTYFNDRTGQSTGGTDGTEPNIGTNTTYNSPRGPTGNLQYQKQFIATLCPADTELALDEIFSQVGGTSAATIDFSAAPSGNAAPTAGSAHVEGKRCPGANVLAFDDHVVWRAFNPAKAAYVTIGTGVISWVPNP